MLLLRGSGSLGKAKAARLDCADHCCWTRVLCHTLGQARRKGLANLFPGAILGGREASTPREHQGPLDLMGLHQLTEQHSIIQVTHS